MKRFLSQIVLFCIFAFFVLLLCEGYYYYSGCFEKNVNGWEVYAAIHQSKTKQKKKKLILGDSVAMQLFPCDNDYDSIASLACNQALSMAGYYFLLTKYLNTNQENLPSEVILLINPLTLSNNLDHFAFHYFLKPFYRTEYYPLFSDYLVLRCQEIPHYWSARLPFIRSSSYSFAYEMPEEQYALVSPIAREYLQRITHALSNRNITFRIVPLPVSEEKRELLDDKYERSIANTELPIEIIQNIQAHTQYYPKECFKDKVHLTDACLRDVDKLQFIK